MAKKKLLIAAAVIGTFAGVLMWLYMQSAKEEVEEIKGDQITVVEAVTDIPSGTTLRNKHLTRTKVPKRYLPNEHIKAGSVEIYLGQSLKTDVKAGDYLLTSDFGRRKGTSELASRIPENERAMAIPVDNISGVAGLLQPGDRVDILGTFQTQGNTNTGGGGKKQGYVTMTLLQNVSLLAVGQRLSGKDDQGNRRRGGYGSVTASVSIEEAELLTIAQTRGDLKLVLRNRDQVDIIPPSRTSLQEVLEDLEIIAKERVERTRKRIRSSSGGGDGGGDQDKDNIPVYREQ